MIYKGYSSMREDKFLAGNLGRSVEVCKVFHEAQLDALGSPRRRGWPRFMVGSVLL